MAVTRMHTDPGKSYDPNKELTNTQRARFSDVANKAEEKREQRELYESVVNPQKAKAKAVAQAREKAKIQQQQAQLERAKRKLKVPELTFWRVLIWSITLGSFWVWVLFMFPSN